MKKVVLNIVGGPDKPALQWALAYPEREPIHFKLRDDSVDARITEMEEFGGGFDFKIRGRAASGPYKGKPFQGTYSVETRSGAITVS